MNEKSIKVAGLTKELLADKLFLKNSRSKHGYEGNIFSYWPEKCCSLPAPTKKEQDNNIMEKK